VSAFLNVAHVVGLGPVAIRLNYQACLVAQFHAGNVDALQVVDICFVLCHRQPCGQHFLAAVVHLSFSQNLTAECQTPTLLLLVLVLVLVRVWVLIWACLWAFFTDSLLDLLLPSVTGPFTPKDHATEETA
jgi:hypothetical protein